MTFPLSQAATEAAEFEFGHIRDQQRTGVIIPHSEAAKRILRAALAAWEPSNDQAIALCDLNHDGLGDFSDWRNALLAAVRTEVE